MLSAMWGPCQVDRFASALCHQLNRYDSRYYNPGAESVDTMSANWSMSTNFWNPPFALLDRVVDKIIQENARGILITPDWRHRPWYRKLVTRVKYDQLKLPREVTMGIVPGVTPELLKNPCWRLIAWWLSGRKD